MDTQTSGEEALRAVERAKRDLEIQTSWWPRVNHTAEKITRLLEDNHLSERIRYALEGHHEHK